MGWWGPGHRQAPDAGRRTGHYVFSRPSGLLTSIAHIILPQGVLLALGKQWGDPGWDTTLERLEETVERVVEEPEEGEPQSPPRPTLLTSYPNPFNVSTTIAYDIVERGRARLAICGIQGNRVRALVDEHTPAGHHRTVRDGAGELPASGTYICRIRASAFQTAIKLMPLR